MASSEAELRALIARVSRAVAARTGQTPARGDLAAIVAAEVAASLEARAPSGKEAMPPHGRAGALCPGCLDEQRKKSGQRAVVTTTGRNQRGMVAKIAQAIADAGGDIVDISQTLVGDYFSMIIVVDMAGLAVTFAEFKARLTAAVQSLGAECLVMHEEVVSALQRV